MKIKKIKSKIKNLKFGKNCTVIEPSNIYGSKFGKNVFIGPFVEIQKNSYIGDNTRVQSHSFICEKVKIGKKLKRNKQTSAPFRIFSGKRQIGKFSILNLVILFSYWQKNSIYLLYNTDLL